MTTNDLMSLIAGIIIDKAYIEYHLDQDIREHSKNVSLLSAKGL